MKLEESSAPSQGWRGRRAVRVFFYRIQLFLWPLFFHSKLNLLHPEQYLVGRYSSSTTCCPKLFSRFSDGRKCTILAKSCPSLETHTSQHPTHTHPPLASPPDHHHHHPPPHNTHHSPTPTPTRPTNPTKPQHYPTQTNPTQGHVATHLI